MAPAAGLGHATSARAILTLALGAYGLVHVVEDLGSPWASIVQTLVLTVLALSFFVAAQRTHDHRAGWLLSGSVIAGLAIAAVYNAVDATATVALPAAGVLVGAVIALFVVRGARQRPRR
jgi:hypothetical protein